jgi:hypothetical protein
LARTGGMSLQTDDVKYISTLHIVHGSLTNFR